MPGELLIRLEDATLGYRGRHLFSGLRFELRRGEFLGVVGPNGGGKSTLLQTLLGLIPPLAGRIETPAAATGKLRFGYVPQREHLDRVFPLQALEVVLMGRYARVGLCRLPGRRDRERALRAMGQVGVAHLATRAFRDMSGGEQQRTLIARALAGDPDVLALDEPTNGMDLPSEGAVMDLLAGLHGEGMTILMVSHVLSTILNHADRMAYVNHDRGLFRTGSVEEMVRDEVLSELYGSPVHVARIGRHRVVLRAADAGDPSGTEATPVAAAGEG
jgi:ABC-type Mn2+/Zn2+ transport system ATPase subunit